MDIYALSLTISFNGDEIKEILIGSNRKLDDFSNFLTRKEELEHAYKMFKSTYSKPKSEEVYSLVALIIQPFLNNEYNKKWNNKEKKYVDVI